MQSLCHGFVYYYKIPIWLCLCWNSRLGQKFEEWCLNNGPCHKYLKNVWIKENNTNSYEHPPTLSIQVTPIFINTPNGLSKGSHRNLVLLCCLKIIDSQSWEKSDHHPGPMMVRRYSRGSAVYQPATCAGPQAGHVPPLMSPPAACCPPEHCACWTGTPWLTRW